MINRDVFQQIITEVHDAVSTCVMHDSICKTLVRFYVGQIWALA